MNQNNVLVFDGGDLTVKADGPVDERFGVLKLDVSLPSWEAEHASFDVPHSELIALRDFLNKIFPRQPTDTETRTYLGSTLAG